MKIKDFLKILQEQGQGKTVDLCCDHANGLMKISGYGWSFLEDGNEWLICG